MKHEGLYREQRRLPGVQMTEVEVHMATYSLFATDHRRQVTHRHTTVAVVASGKGHA